MGVLKKLTDEYFGNDVRNEEGKFIEVHGFKALVPIDFDEKMFLDNAESFVSEGEAEFVEPRYTNIKDENYITIKCNDNHYLSFNKITQTDEDVRDCLKYTLTDKQFESMIKFFEFILDGIEIDRDREKEYLVLADESTVYNKLEMSIYDTNLDDWQSQQCYDDLIDWFLEEFKDKAYIIKDELHYITYYHTSINLALLDTSNHVMFLTLLYAKDMMKWWENHLDDIERMGAREYFGYDDEEEEDEEV